MDSGNSGSMQSSSGGDEEYDSRAESISAFLNPTGHVGPMSNPQLQPPLGPPHPPHPHSSHAPMFDPLSNYFDPLSRSSSQLANPNSLLNLDMVWSKTLRSEPNCTEIGTLMSSSSSGQPFSGAQGQPPPRGPFPSSSPTSMPFHPPVPENATRASASSDQTNVARNSKKRSRASRRAPTTVLTTDTTNFRAMVQEFTGIPAPPFTSSPFPRSRLDLFGTPSPVRSTTHLDPSLQPPYLLRPFAQKVQPPSPFVSSSSSSMVDAIVSSTTNNITSGSTTNTTSNSTSINYHQLPSDLGLLKQPQNQNLLNVHNSPIITFQSLLQSSHKYPLPSTSSAILVGSKSHGSSTLEIPSNDAHLKMGTSVLDEFGLSHGHGHGHGHGHVNNTHLSGGLSNLVSSSDGNGMAASRSDNNHPPSWGNGAAGSNHGNQAHHLRSINGNYSNSHSQHVTNGKINYSSASSSNFHGEKGSENVSTRGEGMVESWICSSE